MSGNTNTINTSIPINTTVPIMTTFPVTTTVPINTTVPIMTTFPVTTTVPVATTVPVTTTVPVATTVPIKTTASTSTTFPTDALFKVFTDSNIVIILWFLVAYFIIYLILNIVRGRDGVRSSMSRWIDIVALFCFLIYLAFSYFDKSDEDKKKMVSNLYSDFKSYLDSPLSIISVGFFIFTLYIVIYILSIPMDSFGKPITISIVENGAWILFVLVLFSTFLKHVAGVSLTDFMDNTGDYLKKKAADADAKSTATTSASSSSTPSSNDPASVLNAFMKSQNIGGASVAGAAGAKSNTTGNLNAKTMSSTKDEVFNIGNNMFTYDDAQSVCASYGARLATYDEVEATYNNGGEWCNYGWSDGQAAYFPTQKSTWQHLQQSESTKNACGRPGVNGGYIDNPNIRFGVNCFGQKPIPKESDLAAMSSGIGITIPKNPEDTLLEKKVEFWKNNRDKLLKINGYNNNKWSMY